MAQIWMFRCGLQVLAPLGALGEALAVADQAAKFCARHPSYDEVSLALLRHALQHDLGRSDLARQGARQIAAHQDLLPEEQARLSALQLALNLPADSAALLDFCARSRDLRLRAHLLCRAGPGLPAPASLPLLAQSAAEARVQGALGLGLMLQASQLAALRKAGADPGECQALALALWAQLAQGLVAPVPYPSIAAQLCATLAATRTELAQTIALRAGAWMLNAAATLPPAWRHNYLSRAPLLQALPPLQRGLLFSLAGAAAPLGDPAP